jgi:hypothetical protein
VGRELVSLLLPLMAAIDRAPAAGSRAARSAVACDAVGALEAVVGARDDGAGRGRWVVDCTRARVDGVCGLLGFGVWVAGWRAEAWDGRQPDLPMAFKHVDAAVLGDMMIDGLTPACGRRGRSVFIGRPRCRGSGGDAV